MDMQTALRARILASGPVAAAGGRVYWVERPQGTALPAFTLQTISSGRDPYYKGDQDLRQTRVQADVWSSTYATARSLAEALISAVEPPQTANGIRFDRVFIDSERDLGEQPEGAPFIHRISIDLIVWWATA